MKKLLQLFALILLCVSPSRATHIVGGNLGYTQLLNNNYEVRLTLFRDCIDPNNFDFQDSLYVRAIDKLDSQNDTSFLMKFTSRRRIPNILPSPCMDSIFSICYEVTTYIDTFYIPPSAGGYLLFYQICCRNRTIVNIELPGGASSVYTAEIPKTSITSNNSNPKFKNWSPTFVCAGEPLLFDHSAIDLDGDSLVYMLHRPYENIRLNWFNPALNSLSGVVWQSPFSTVNMLGGDTPLAIDSKTGLLTAMPNSLGQFVVGIKVKEYRKGVYLGETIRDYQFNVVSCNFYTVASLSVSDLKCGDSNATFVNNSAGQISSYLWDFGVQATETDSSTFKNPTFKYTNDGVYNVRLIAYSSYDPTCHDTAYKTLTVSPKFTLNYSIQTSECSPIVNFKASSEYDKLDTTIYEWEFGDGGTSQLANENYVYSQSGLYTVSLRGETLDGCLDSIQQQLKIKRIEEAYLPNVFTPNGDKINDTLFVEGSLESMELRIYNRWGRLVFESTDKELGWDGKENEEPAVSGVYFYELMVWCSESEYSSKKGHVTLLR